MLTYRENKTFLEVLKRLREKWVHYSMAYQCWMRVQHEGMVKFFDSPEEVDSHNSFSEFYTDHMNTNISLTLTLHVVSTQLP